VFIYRSLLEYYLYGNTRIEANIFRSTYSNLKKNKQNLLISEYNVSEIFRNLNDDRIYLFRNYLYYR
jgi:hypothetical protein